MKRRNYEKKKGILTLIFFFCLLEILLLFHFIKEKWNDYQVFQGVVVKNDLVILILSQKELDYFYQNHFIYVANQRVKFHIKKITREVLTRGKKSYHEVILSFPFSNKRKENDVILLSIRTKRKRFIEIFNIIWEEIT